MSRPLRVLLVGTRARALLAQARAIRRQGWENVSAGDLPHALARLRALKPAAVVVDGECAALDPVRVVRRLREAGAGEVPLLLVTAGEAGAREALLAAGAGAVLPDAFDAEGLCALLRAHFASASASAVAAGTASQASHSLFSQA